MAGLKQIISLLANDRAGPDGFLEHLVWCVASGGNTLGRDNIGLVTTSAVLPEEGFSGRHQPVQHNG